MLVLNSHHLALHLVFGLFKPSHDVVILIR